MSRRSRAREIVLQVLYQEDLNPPGDTAAAEVFLRKRLNDDPALIAFAASLLEGVRGRREELDKLLAERTENWSLGRMAVTDRNVLRLGAFEILFTETPDRVAINEAVELAKRFGAKQSPPFVNGVLDRFLQKPRESPEAIATASESLILPVAAKELVSALESPTAQVPAAAERRPSEGAKRVPSAEEYARALNAIAERPGERKFPAYYRTLLTTHCGSGSQAASDLAEAMGWDSAALLLARYGELGKRLSEELHFDPPLYDASGGPIWISVLAVASEGAERSPECGRWELRDEVAAALKLLGWL